ncbi:MAG TPA: hypothetical protein VE954_27045 [Oligoflexus sp.]|uniref:hypothetical protein n=1 Tax=Oligoflexus sp. TaxID=1971216 RepID=UPI002D38ADF8|nr:hypothetical protein [Oligoflexus sp.]HYX36781.1 hypothetical protein [Oligoflexus sp.]
MLKKGWSQKKIPGFAALEKTLLHFKIQGERLEEFPTGDSIAPQLRAGTVLQISDL